MIVHTLGHSTRSAEAFVKLLREHGIALLADVRRYPASRRHPQFAGDALAATLADAGIAYRHLPALGGRRASEGAGSVNAGWRNASFRAYADHALTPEFQIALEGLITEAEERPTAIMCAEAVPWRCHRWVISDHLVARGIEVRHVTGPGEARLHTLNPHARIREDGLVVYPAGQGELF
jgi:uncharacterized protein (DUF488 family)